VRFPFAFALGAFVAFVTAYFFSPQLGKRRRHVLRDRSLRVVRRGRRLAVGKTKYAAGHVQGAAAEARRTVVKPDVPTDDATVRQRILSDALREALKSDPEVRDQIEVDVQEGVATLRGSVPNESLVDELVSKVREVPGVKAVSPELTVGAR
jgi:osmotically-inducible protein OsmY